MSTVWDLFFTFLKIGLFSIGGGYAVIPSIHEQVVVENGWIGEKIFTDIITISQMTPGPLAVNTSTFVGLRIGGVQGAVAATGGCVLCGVLISLALYRFFQKHHGSACVFEILKGLKSASLGLILSASATILTLAFWGTGELNASSLLSGPDWTAVILFTVFLFLLRKRKPNPILVILLSGAAGLVFYFP